MALLIPSDDPRLRQKAEPVDPATIGSPEFRSLVHNLWTGIDEDDHGVGIAAPQIGVSQRVILVRHPEYTGIIVNPKWQPAGRAKTSQVEGCLSFPGEGHKKKRWETIQVEGYDEEGRKFLLKARGLLARILQHECDHLDGRCIPDP